MPVALPPKFQEVPCAETLQGATPPISSAPAQKRNGKTWHGEIAGRTLTHFIDSINLGCSMKDEAIGCSLYCLRLCIVFKLTSIECMPFVRMCLLCVEIPSCFAAISLTLYTLHIHVLYGEQRQLTCNSPRLSLCHLTRTASL